MRVDGDKVTLTITRNGSSQTLTATLGRQPTLREATSSSAGPVMEPAAS